MMDTSTVTSTLPLATCVTKHRGGWGGEGEVKGNEKRERLIIPFILRVMVASLYSDKALQLSVGFLEITWRERERVCVCV